MLKAIYNDKVYVWRVAVKTDSADPATDAMAWLLANNTMFQHPNYSKFQSLNKSTNFLLLP